MRLDWGGGCFGERKKKTEYYISFRPRRTKMAEEMQMRMIKVNGRRCLFVCDLLAEFFPEEMFHFDIRSVNGRSIKISGEISRDFANVIYDDIRELDVVSISSCSQKNLSGLMYNVVPHLWKDRNVSFKVIDSERGYCETLEWNTSNPLPRTYEALMEMGERIEPHLLS